MKKSKVTECIIRSLENRHISPEEAERVTGIPARKLKKDYREPLYAEEFLRICVYLGIRPEEVAEAIRKES